MSVEEGMPEFDHGARRLHGAMLEHPSLAIDRMPGLSFALNRFIAEAPARLASLIARPSGAAIEEIRAQLEQQIQRHGLQQQRDRITRQERRHRTARHDRVAAIVTQLLGRHHARTGRRQDAHRHRHAALHRQGTQHAAHRQHGAHGKVDASGDNDQRHSQ